MDAQTLAKNLTTNNEQLLKNYGELSKEFEDFKESELVTQAQIQNLKKEIDTYRKKIHKYRKEIDCYQKEIEKYEKKSQNFQTKIEKDKKISTNEKELWKNEKHDTMKNELFIFICLTVQ